MKLREIGVADTDRFQVERLHLNKKTVANLLTLFTSMMNLAVDLAWLIKAPKVKKPRVRLFEKDFSYLRTEEEIRRFLGAAEAEGELVYMLYATALYTGTREGELAALQWDDVDLEKRLITVQRSFEGPTKAEDVRYVPILDPLLPLLKRWRLRCPGKLLFPNQRGGMQCPSARIFQEVLHRVLDAAELPESETGGRARRYITFHGTRHTFASQWMLKGGDIFKLQKILGHKDIKMTQRYAHLAPAAFAGAGSARLGPEPRRRRRPHPGDEAPQVHRGEPRRRRPRAHQGRGGPTRRDTGSRRHLGPALQPAADGDDRPLVRMERPAPDRRAWVTLRSSRSTAQGHMR